MTTLRIEHTVMDYDTWKAAFDSDPAGRERSGVRRYQVHRAVDEPNLVLIDLEFDTTPQAVAMLTGLRGIWEHVTGILIEAPHARITEAVETKTY